MLLEKAIEYKNAGLSVIGCINKKSVLNSWKPYQDRIASDEELNRMFTKLGASQIAIVCGFISGNLEIVDIDENEIVDEIWEAICELFDNPPVTFVKTKNGAHIYYRCSTIEGNQKLARHPKQKNGTVKVRCETRGEGGYAVAPPSKNYTTIHGSLTDIKTIKEHEREDILDICRSYNLYFETEQKKTIKGIDPSEFSETPWDKYNEDEREPWQDVLTAKGWTINESHSNAVRQQWKRPGTKNPTSANWHFEKRIFFVHTSSTVFESDKGYTPFAILSQLEFNGDYSKAAKHIIQQGYGVSFNSFEKSVIKECLINIENFDDIKDFLSDNYAEIKPEASKKIVEAVNNYKAYKGVVFWGLTDKGKVVFDEEKTARYLEQIGIYTLSSVKNSDNFKTVYIDKENHSIEEIGKMKGVVEILKENIKDIDFQSFGVSKREVLKMLMKVTANRWAQVLAWLEQILLDDLDILRDDKNNIYHFFKNGIVHITKNEISVVDYKDLEPNKLIWKSSIIDREIYICATDNEYDLNQSNFYRFVKRLSGLPRHSNVNTELAFNYHTKERLERFLAMITTIGYLSSNYKDAARPKAVIIAEDTSDQGLGGGTGKSLLIKAISKLRNVVSMSGKDWNPDKSFVYQSVQIDTDLLCLEDTTNYFDFQRLYNVITDGIHIEKKNKDEIFIPFELSPKIAMTTNYDIGDNTQHSLRRQHKVLVSNYFNANLSPLDEYNERFFEDWNDEAWNWFYNILFVCNKEYLDHGLLKQVESINMKRKAIKTKFTEEFYSFVVEKLNDNPKYEFLLKDSYKLFIEESGQTERSFSNRRFNAGLRYFGEKLGLKVNEYKSRMGEDRNRKVISFEGKIDEKDAQDDYEYIEEIGKNGEKVTLKKQKIAV